MDHYILTKSGRVQLEPDFHKWADWFRSANRRVGVNDVNGVKISTVFLGMDHRWFPDRGQPILFETMTFGPAPWDERQWRYRTLGQALGGHYIVMDAVRNGLDPEMIDPNGGWSET
jgi:hypothetical protein